MQTSLKIRQIISYILLILGIISIVLGVISYYHQKIPSNYLKTTGTIVSIKTDTPTKTNNPYSNTNTIYYPIVSFEVNNQNYQFNGAGQYYPPLPTDPNAVNKKVSVSYNPVNPSTLPRLTTDHGPIVFGSVISGLGLFMCLVSYFLYFRGRKHKSL